MTRYIVSQENASRAIRTSVRERLEEFPEIEILRSNDPDHAVVLMDSETEVRVRNQCPELELEPDTRHRMVARR